MAKVSIIIPTYNIEMYLDEWFEDSGIKGKNYAYLNEKSKFDQYAKLVRGGE